MDDASLDDFVDSEADQREASDTASGEERPASSDSEADQREASKEASGEAANSEADQREASESERRPEGAVSSPDPSAEDEPSDSTVDPAETTYQWSAEGVVCTACGSEINRRWQTDEGLVCPDCKEW